MAISDTKVAEDLGILGTRPAPPIPRKARPVLWWAGLGAGFVSIYIYTFVRYLSDIPPNIPAGPTHVPTYMLVNIRAQEIFWPLLACVVLTKFVFKPLFRHTKIPWDGVAALAYLPLLWQSYGVDWFSWFSGFNAIVINRGSWYQHIPFWVAPNAQKGFAEAPLWDIGFMGSWILVNVWLCYLLRGIKNRWPHLGKAGLFLSLLGVSIVLDFCFEVVFMRGGLYHYAGSIRGPWLLFPGHHYQFPLYEAVLFGSCIAGMAAIRYFRNDRGESLAERGIEDVNVSTRTKTWIRGLALCGIFNVVFLAYNLSLVPFSMHGSPWPEDVRKRSYYTQGLCEGKTDRACPGPGVPIARPGSAYLTPEGKLSHPKGDEWNGPPSPRVPFAP